MIKTKVRKDNITFAIMEADEYRNGDIIEELRKDRILHPGLKRTDFRYVKFLVKMKIQITGRTHHDCDLPQTLQKFHTKSPYDSWIGKLGSSIRFSTTVNQKIFRTEYFKSSSAYRQELKRHLLNPRYKYIIHPYSIFSQVKTQIVAVLMLLAYISESFNNAFVLQQKGTAGMLVKIIGNIIVFFEFLLLIDVVFKFYEGYVDPKTREIVLEPRRIVRKYLKTYFFIDMLPVLGALAFTVYLIFHPHVKDTPEKVKFYSYFFLQVHRVRVGRIKLLVDAVETFMKKLHCSEEIRVITFLLLLGFITLHTFNCLGYDTRHFQKHMGMNLDDSWKFFYVNRERNKQERLSKISTDPAETETTFSYAFYLYFLHGGVICSYFFGLGVSLYRTQNSVEMSFYAIVVICGLIFNTYCAARLLGFFGVVNIAELKYEEFMVQSEEFMKRRKVPKKLKTRVSKYLKFKYNGRFFWEKNILDTLSQHLQLEILLYSCAGLINEVSIFRGLTKDAAGCLLALLKQEIYLKGDSIHESADNTGSLYFVLHGTCEIIMLPLNTEVMHLQDGDHFGDVTSYDDSDIVANYTVKAIEGVELFKLEAKDIEYCCKVYPEIFKKINGLARANIRRYNTLFSNVQAEEDTTGDILEELRKGRILYHGIKRSDLR